jgi:hypothetical protein
MTNVQSRNVGNASVMGIGALAEADVYNVLRCHLKTFYRCANGSRQMGPTCVKTRSYKDNACLHLYFSV